MRRVREAAKVVVVAGIALGVYLVSLANIRSGVSPTTLIAVAVALVPLAWLTYALQRRVAKRPGASLVTLFLFNLGWGFLVALVAIGVYTALSL